MRCKLDFSRLILLVGTGAAIFVSISTLAGPPSEQAQSQAGSGTQQKGNTRILSFEVASIKPSASDDRTVFVSRTTGGRYMTSGATLKLLIQQAYIVRDYQISNAPRWASSERYDIVAKAEDPNATEEQMRTMLQSLLAERFHLKLHHETRSLPIYNLIVGSNGPKLKKSEVQPNAGPIGQRGNPAKLYGPGAPNSARTAGGGAAADSGSPVQLGGAGGGPRRGSFVRMGRVNLGFQAVPLSVLAERLAQILGRPVIDETGLTGFFDFSLEYTPIGNERGMGLGGSDTPDQPALEDTFGPFIFKALQEQLGLKLEPKKRPVDILVIDSVERPTPRTS